MLEGFAIEDSDVVGKADVEATNAFEAADVGIEVPDVLVALVAFEIVFGTRELLDKEVLGHEVKLERDVDLHIIVRHVEHIDKDFFVAIGIGPELIGKNLHVTDAVEIEDARTFPIDVVCNHKIVFGFHIIGLDQAVFYSTAIVGGIAVKDSTAFLRIGLLQE